jgi:2-dehydropantoate 2-reductase
MSLKQTPERARLLVVGAGATGGYFGGRLAQAGKDVTFLVRPSRAEQLRSGGLHLISPHGDVALVPALVEPGKIGAPYDVVILAVKAYSLEAAIADFAPAVGPGTVIVPFLNGMHHLDVLTKHFGKSPVFGGVCIVSTTIDEQGRIVQLAGLQRVVYGELDGTASARTAGLDRAMQGCGFEAASSPAILRDMWQKWVMLATLGAANCLLRGTIGEIEAAGGAAIVLALLEECYSVADASGYPLGAEFLSTTTALLTAKGSPTASSMYRDLQAGKSVEVDQILGDMLARARHFALDVPLLAAATTQLSIYQRRLTEKGMTDGIAAQRART